MLDSTQMPLLLPKLQLPRLHTALVVRERLLARLDEGLDARLTLLSAPAGFGKTTLVSQWLSHFGSGMVAWLSLDGGDNDPIRFWRYVINACQAFQPGLGESALALLRGLPHPTFEAALTPFINDLARLSGRQLLVLEDYHEITSGQIHQQVGFLLDHLPASLHLIMITRHDPPLPLARLRARNELNEIHSGDLRFSVAEIEAFLRQTLSASLPAEVMARLEARTEGWIAGLRLVALALQRHQEVEPFINTFTGSHGHILEYLVEEVLRVQPEPIQAFLLQTTFLSRLTASLCDTLLDRKNSGLILEQLERANLFLTPLDETRHWYRYHALFAEAISHYARQRLGETALLALQEKASHWYEQHGFLNEAVEMALSAQSFSRAARLMDEVIEQQSFYKELHTLRRWIERLPEAVQRCHPTLCFTHALAILFIFDRRAPETAARFEAPLRMAEAAWQAEDNPAGLGQVLVFRSLVAWWQGDLSYAFAAARQSLELLPEDDLGWRGAGLLNLSMEELLAGRLALARQTVLEAQTLCEAAGNIHGVLAARATLAEIFTRQGKLHQAAGIYRQILAEARTIEVGEPEDDEGHALLGLAGLAYEWNELETAHQSVTQALDFGRQLGAEELIVPATLLLARLKQIAGEVEPAQQLLHELAAQVKQPHRLREVQAGLAWLWLLSGNLAAVQRWSTTSAQAGAAPFVLQQEREALIVARMFLAQGEGDAALRLLEPWLAEAKVQVRGQSELEMLLLKALAFFTANNLPQARQTLIGALRLAQPEGYCRLFLNEGEKMVLLLQATLPQLKEALLVAYVQKLLSAFSQKQVVLTAAPKVGLTVFESLVESLSPQEERVLRLLAAGLSNPEIAEELVVSVNTIKTQVKSIYRKLDVHSRDEAREVAQRLNLL